MNIDNKVVIISGGSGVMGSHIAGELHARGANLVLGGRNQPKLQRVAEALPGTLTATYDLLQPSTLNRPIDVALKRFGRIDGLVNAAGVVAFGSFEETPQPIVDHLFRVNMSGPLELSRQSLAHMDEGFIVNLTGIVATHPTAGMAAYSASKAGLSAASSAMSRELRRRRILVVDARPPHTETGLAGRAIYGEAPSLGKGLDPRDVAKAVVRGIEEGKRTIEADSFANAAA